MDALNPNLRIAARLCLAGMVAWAQCASGQPAQVDGAQTSEWEATAFNNGRRMARDSNGYFHAVWHTSATLPAGPAGLNCDVFYSHTNTPATEPPSMAQKGAWVTPVNMTQNLGFGDNRYPSIAIEYDVYDGQYPGTNRLHVVWQALPSEGTRYDVYHANIPVSAPPVAPAAWTMPVVTNLSQTAATDSLVPAIAINRHNPDVTKQHLHVVWQEEDVDNGGALPPPAEDLWFSDIAYVRSVDSGATWAPPQGGWAGNPWDNLTTTPAVFSANSQMPTISCTLDQHTGVPAQAGQNDLGYNSDDVHVAFNTDTAGGMTIYYLRSPDDGATWLVPVNISAATSGGLNPQDAYPNIAADMLDQPHIIFMRNNITQNEPLRTGPQYQAGIAPLNAQAFPGPYVGMYGTQLNSIVYTYFNGAAWSIELWTGPEDLEFPTVALDRWQNVTANWQEFYGIPTNDYEIGRVYNNNATPPGFPVQPQLYGGWVLVNDSNDVANNDLFPNLAHKKVAMYSFPNEGLLPPLALPGYDEAWTKILGKGPTMAVNPATPRQIMQDGNMGVVAVPVTLSRFLVE